MENAELLKNQLTGHLVSINSLEKVVLGASTELKQQLVTIEMNFLETKTCLTINQLTSGVENQLAHNLVCINSGVDRAILDASTGLKQELLHIGRSLSETKISLGTAAEQANMERIDPDNTAVERFSITNVIAAVNKQLESLQSELVQAEDRNRQLHDTLMAMKIIEAVDLELQTLLMQEI